MKSVENDDYICHIREANFAVSIVAMPQQHKTIRGEICENQFFFLNLDPNRGQEHFSINPKERDTQKTFSLYKVVL